MTNHNFSSTDNAILRLARAIRATGYQFITVTPATHERVNSRPENAQAQNLAGVFGWSRPFAPDVLPPEIWELMREADVAQRCEIQGGECWRSSIRVSNLGGQLFVHSAYPTTNEDSVFFGPDTYRYAAALQTLFSSGVRFGNAVDLGSGAGLGAILCALAQPDARVLAGDINEAALRFTRINAELAGVNLEARHSDLLANFKGEFDLIISNPPYLVDANERAYRHGGGTLGAGLSLRIVEAATERLARGGTLLLYTGAAIIEGEDLFREAVTQRNGEGFTWTYHEVDPDVFGEELESGAYAHADRIAAVVLTLTRN